MSFTMSENRTAPAQRGPGLRAMFPYAAIKTVPKNTLLITEGNRATDAVYLIESGRVKIFLSNANGKEIDLGILGPGDFFGETELDLEPRSVSALTTESCRLAVIPQAEFRRLILENPEFAMDLVLKLISRTRDLLKNVKSLALEDVTDRVARLLVEMATEEDGKLIINEKLSKRDIANRVGATREMASRVFKNLLESGFIQLENKRITISKRMAGLVAVAGVVGLAFMIGTSDHRGAAAPEQLAGAINALPATAAGAPASTQTATPAPEAVIGTAATGRVAQVGKDQGAGRWVEVRLAQPLADGTASVRALLERGVADAGEGDIVEIRIAAAGAADSARARVSRLLARKDEALAQDFERSARAGSGWMPPPASVKREPGPAR